MKISVKRDDILKALNHVQSVVERRNAIPILSNVKISSINKSSINLTTTDLDISISDNCQAQVEKEGAITIPVTALYDFARKAIDNVDITIESKDGSDSVLITTSSSEFSLPSIPANEFPNFEAGEYSHKLTIHSEILKTLFSKTRHAVSNEETRYYLNGIYFHCATAEDGTKVLRAVATDGHRLARAETIEPEGCANMPNIIIPKKTVGEVIKILESYTGEVAISLSEKKITFTFGDTILSSKLIDGKFPDYERVIPRNNDKQLEVSRDTLARSIDLVTSISNDKTRAVKFNIEPSKIVISATSDINGSARGTQEIAANYNSNEPIIIGFNSKYVLDSLAAIDGNNVKVSLSNSLGAVIAQDANEASCMYILMPMQV